MIDYTRLPLRNEAGDLLCVVETPRGGVAKLKFEPKLGVFVLARPLVLGTSYPFDWGFFPSTRAADGDPLDAMIYHQAATFPGVVIPCRPLGILRVSQKKKKREPHAGRERNDRILLVPTSDPRMKDVRALGKRIREELEEFFVSTVLFQQKKLHIGGWGSPEEALAVIEEAAHDAKKRRKNAASPGRHGRA